MTDQVLIALITGGAGVLGGIFGSRGFDKIKNGKNGHGNGKNGNGSSLDSVLARRAELEFQTRITLLMGQLTAAIERGHDRALVQMTRVSEAITDAAGAIRQVHDEIVSHRETIAPATAATLETLRLVKGLQRETGP